MCRSWTDGIGDREGEVASFNDCQIDHVFSYIIVCSYICVYVCACIYICIAVFDYLLT